MIKAVVFDMYGVLFDTERISEETWRKIGQKRHMERIDEAHTGCIGLNRNDGEALLRRMYGQSFDAGAFIEEARRENARVIDEQGLPLKPGVREILHYLQERQMPVAICSSTNVKTIQSHLERTGLTGYFQVIIGGNLVEHSKPEPDIYWKACEALGMQPQDCMAVEDSPNGIRSAARAGMQTVMVPDLVPPTPELLALCARKEESLLTLLAYLKKMERDEKQ